MFVALQSRVFERCREHREDIWRTEHFFLKSDYNFSQPRMARSSFSRASGQQRRNICWVKLKWSWCSKRGGEIAVSDLSLLELLKLLLLAEKKIPTNSPNIGWMILLLHKAIPHVLLHVIKVLSQWKHSNGSKKSFSLLIF